ncbi:hypothetical protein E2542_SST31587 [Spatholobus suberectus]|nr:hypothetical protein E2542_SST31587 [Spatholobus suberectus]
MSLHRLGTRVKELGYENGVRLWWKNDSPKFVEGYRGIMWDNDAMELPEFVVKSFCSFLHNIHDIMKTKEQVDKNVKFHITSMDSFKSSPTFSNALTICLLAMQKINTFDPKLK